MGDDISSRPIEPPVLEEKTTPMIVKRSQATLQTAWMSFKRSTLFRRLKEPFNELTAHLFIILYAMIVSLIVSVAVKLCGWSEKQVFSLKLEALLFYFEVIFLGILLLRGLFLSLVRYKDED